MARGDGRIFQRGSTFWCGYYLNGKQIRESAHTPDEKEAQKFLKARLREVGAHQIGARQFVTPSANRKTILDLTKALRTNFELLDKASPQNLSVIGRVERDCGKYRATALTSEMIDKYIQSRLAEGYAHASVNRVTGMLLQCYKLGVRNKHFPESVIPTITHLPEDNARRDFIEPADFTRLLTFLPDDGLRDFCEWAYATGMRKGEATSLRWDMLDGTQLNIPAAPYNTGCGTRV